ncbi:cation:proton antiporter regulatory subunit [Nocardia speluncae]|uniref:Cation:proton antiporter regulatory subunit n=1 Tax=Nocardia speluncae TaxID=419477 RepID=A0A846X8A7_9NOCA|nr:TrkA C-terminal domain-containing protein [Nocardia speluncae]NKY32192.1 cation:proton antiporter regulatory subunit [Nocardia speluncae]
MNVEVTPLPGIGVRKDFPLTTVRRRIGVVDHKDGAIDLIFTKIGDPDATTQIPMTEAEAGTLANLLGAPQLVGQLRNEYRDMDGVNTRQLPVGENSPYDGRTLGETRMRTRTKVSIVAVLRAGQTMPSPGPDFVFTGGDMLVVVGTSEGLDSAASILKDG